MNSKHFTCLVIQAQCSHKPQMLFFFFIISKIHTKQESHTHFWLHPHFLYNCLYFLYSGLTITLSWNPLAKTMHNTFLSDNHKLNKPTVLVKSPRYLPTVVHTQNLFHHQSHPHNTPGGRLWSFLKKKENNNLIMTIIWLKQLVFSNTSVIHKWRDIPADCY